MYTLNTSKLYKFPSLFKVLLSTDLKLPWVYVLCGATCTQPWIKCASIPWQEALCFFCMWARCFVECHLMAAMWVVLFDLSSNTIHFILKIHLSYYYLMIRGNGIPWILNPRLKTTTLFWRQPTTRFVQSKIFSAVDS